MLISVHPSTNKGYIAGTADGIVTVQGKPASRMILVFNSVTSNLVGVTKSTVNGNYLFMGLDPNNEYLIIARDYQKQFEPFSWDYVKPADDLTVDAQQALWESWQT